ncbi:MAG TPA: DUF2127 domain-containing protein [Thermoanaerobaculia bacterium]|jgi:uncharacterized membrane protein (DUF2068 family)
MTDAVRDRGVLLIAIFKLAKAITLVAAGIGAFRLLNPAAELRVERWIAHVQLAPAHRVVRFLSGASDGKIEALGSLAFGYALLFLIEGTGLLMRKRWAEWFTIVVTGSLLPFEIYELFKGATLAKIATVIINAAVVIYLVIRVRKRA